MAYKIKSGDTLSQIAKTQGTTTQDLMKLNPNITDPNKIYAGGSLNLPTAISAPTTDVISAPYQPKTSSSIGVDQLSTGTTPIPPPPITTPPVDVNATIAGATTNLPSTPTTPPPTTQAEQDLTAARTQQTGIFDRLNTLYGDLTGKGKYQAEQLATAGISQQEKDIQDLTSQLNTIKAESEARKVQAERQAMATGGETKYLRGEQALIDRQTATESLLISSQLQAKQGNLQLALGQVQRAVDMKYQPMEDEIKNRENQLTLLDKYVLTPAEQARKDELTAQNEKDKAALADKKAKETELNKNILDAQQGGLSLAEANNARDLFNAGKIDEANALLAPYSSIAQKRTIDLQTLQQQQEKDKFNQDLALKKFNEDQRQFGLKYAQDQADRDAKNRENAKTKELTSVGLDLQSAKLKGKFDLLNSLISRVNTDGSGIIGPSWLSRWSLGNTINGKEAAFVGDVRQLISQETLDTLINLKRAGGTLGALSDQERVMLQNAATKLGNWEVKDKNGDPTGVWSVKEEDFKKELSRIKDLTNIALINSGGGMLTSPDGTQEVSVSDLTSEQILEAANAGWK